MENNARIISHWETCINALQYTRNLDLILSSYAFFITEIKPHLDVTGPEAERELNTIAERVKSTIKYTEDYLNARTAGYDHEEATNALFMGVKLIPKRSTTDIFEFMAYMDGCKQTGELDEYGDYESLCDWIEEEMASPMTHQPILIDVGNRIDIADGMYKIPVYFEGRTLGGFMSFTDHPQIMCALTGKEFNSADKHLYSLQTVYLRDGGRLNFYVDNKYLVLKVYNENRKESYFSPTIFENMVSENTSFYY